MTPAAVHVLPTVAVNPKAAQRLRRNQNWCYRQDILGSLETADLGPVVQVVDGQKNPIGQAFYASRSPVALRLLTRRPPNEEPVDEAFFRRRLEASLARRASLQGRDALRLVHGEADLLPGLFVDRYGDALVVQTLSEGMDVREELVVRLLVELTRFERVVLRNDGSGRDFEGLERRKGLVVGKERGSVARYHEGENRFEVDLLEDFKTGSFLDQVSNHLRAGELARGTALDCFTYHGGFALALSRSCSSVLAVDQDEGAVARARRNVEANGRSNVTVEQANAFDLLRRLEAEGQRFDTIVLDPPGFSKRKEGVNAALRAYHELNLRAFRLLSPNGLLVSCSCSGKVTPAAFEETLVAAAKDAKRTVQLLERRGAGIDHPILAALPETEYLKAFFLRAL